MKVMFVTLIILSSQTALANNGVKAPYTPNVSELRECGSWFVVSSQIFESYIAGNTGGEPEFNKKMNKMMVNSYVAIFQEIGRRTGRTPEHELTVSKPHVEKYTKDFVANSGGNWPKWIDNTGIADHCLNVYKSM